MQIFVFIIGLFIGSFLNVLAERLPRGESVLWGRSHCDFCKKNLRWFELIPLFSYIFQRGRCLRCHKKVSVQYPLSELVTGLGFAFLYPSVPLIIVFCTLLVIFISDLKYQIIPDSMVIVGGIGALLYHITPDTILSAVGSFAFLFLLWILTRRRGIGFGDVKFAVLMGLFLGFPDIIIAFYAAFLTGAFVGVILILRGTKSWKSKIAFGPFLIFGSIIAYLWSPQILVWWQKFI